MSVNVLVSPNSKQVSANPKLPITLIFASGVASKESLIRGVTTEVTSTSFPLTEIVVTAGRLLYGENRGETRGLG